MSDDLRRLLNLQRRRLVGSLMGHAERELYPDLTEQQRKAYRDNTLASVDAYHEVMLDILGARDPNELVNAEAIDLLREVRDALARAPSD
jgi:hypothetical protein